MKKNSGFTLIELMVVIAIIGILSTVVFAQLSLGKRKSQDGVRLSDARSVITALLLYKDSHGTFPCISYDKSTNAGFMSFLATDGLLTRNPVDPVNSDSAGLFYEFWTLKSYPGGPCGELGAFGYFMDRPVAICVGGKGAQSAPFLNHCHIVVPGPFPCSDPYQEMWPTTADCIALRDL